MCLAGSLRPRSCAPQQPRSQPTAAHPPLPLLPSPPVYLPDLPAYLAYAADEDKPVREAWAQSCALLYTDGGWRHVFWDGEAATRLVEQVSPRLLVVTVGWGGW